ncbi:MAG: hypothetical protein ACKO8I_18970 [Cyanobacteriota bacterium]
MADLPVPPRPSDGPSNDPANNGPSDPAEQGTSVRSPLEAYSSYRGADWTPERLAFHQNLESFADRVGLIVGLQSNGKISQEQAYTEIRKVWKELKGSKDTLLR